MCDYWEDDETHCEKMQQKKTTPTTQHSYFHFCTFLSCYWFLKWPELTEIPQCSLEINSRFLSRRNCLHGRKGKRGKKTHLAIWSNFFFFKDSINRACNEILSSFFSSFAVILLLILEALRSWDLPSGFWTEKVQAPATELERKRLTFRWDFSVLPALFYWAPG